MCAHYQLDAGTSANASKGTANITVSNVMQAPQKGWFFCLLQATKRSKVTHPGDRLSDLRVFLSSMDVAGFRVLQATDALACI